MIENDFDGLKKFHFLFLQRVLYHHHKFNHQTVKLWKRLEEKHLQSPKIKAMLAMLEPSTLPTAVSVFPSKAAVADTIISGADDPIAKIVMPITNGEMPKLRASAAEPKTNLSALQTKNTKPTMRNATASIMMIPN